MAHARQSSSGFNLISCLSSVPVVNDELPKSSVPILALVNGLSGGHKGEKVQRLLKAKNIPAFDLFHLSTDQKYFQSLVEQLNEIYDSLV